MGECSQSDFVTRFLEKCTQSALINFDNKILVFLSQVESWGAQN